MKSAEALRDEYLVLLDGKHKEQVYQEFLGRNTRLIPREFVQNHGLHLRLVLRKVPFGADYKSDFFYLSKSTDDWNAVFIELEKPQSRFFRRGSNKFHSDFVDALQQIHQWKAWFLTEGNQQAFLTGTVNSLRVPHVMASNPTYNKYVLVFGRRSEYVENGQRRSLIKAQETDDFKIITFDSLAEALTSKSELYLGIRRNQYIDILTNEVVDASLFAWVDPSQLRVSETLHDKLMNGPRSNHHRFNDGESIIEALTYAAPRVRVRSGASADF